MRAEDELQFMADFYPSIFPTRKHALHHLFCLIGNGYDWVDGELVSECARTSRYMLKESVEKAKFAHPNGWVEPIHKLLTESPEDLGKVFRHINFEGDKDWIYLYNYPEDIKDDWKALIEECKEYIREEGHIP